MKCNPLKIIFFQMPPGLNWKFGPDPHALTDPHPLKLKKVRTRRRFPLNQPITPSRLISARLCFIFLKVVFLFLFFSVIFMIVSFVVL